VGLVMGVLKALLADGQVDRAFIDAHTEGFAELEAQVRATPWSELEEISGLPRSEMERLAAIYAKAKTAVLVWSMGLTQHRHGVENVRAITFLGLARGMVGWDVSVLEFFLARRNFGPGVVDGRFTDRTAGAVRRLQRQKNLVVDGVVGSQTLAALQKRRASAKPAAPPPTMLAVQHSLKRWARYYGVSLRLVRALSWMESGFRWNAKSSAGAWGALQVTPGTWRYVENFIIAHNVPRTLNGGVRVGVAYLHQLLHEFNFNVRKALGAYYQGPYAVRRYGLYGETRQFVRNVLALRSRFSSV